MHSIVRLRDVSMTQYAYLKGPSSWEGAEVTWHWTKHAPAASDAASAPGRSRICS